MRTFTQIVFSLLLLTLAATADAGGSTWTSWRRPWIPRDAGGAVLWVSARDLSTTPVGTWSDASGAGHNLTQATTANKPAWSATSGPASHPCVTSDGVNDELQAAFTLAQPTQVFVIWKAITLAFGTGIMDGVGGNKLRIYEGSSTAFVMNAGTDLTVNNLTPTLFHMGTALFNGGSSTYKQDGVSKASGNAGSATSGGLTLFTFGDGSSNPINASVCEVIIFPSAVSAFNENAILEYEKRQWGF